MLTKATLVDDVGRVVQFQFNPETLQFTAKGKFSTKSQADDAQYLGPEPIVLTLKMLLDEATSTEPVQSGSRRCRVGPAGRTTTRTPTSSRSPGARSRSARRSA